MSTVKSYAVGAGDMFYIRHNGDNFTVIDCDLCEENADEIIDDIKSAKTGKKITRFICTHPDEDHFGGLHLLDEAISILNFYVVKNQAIKDRDTDSFRRYCELRDNEKKAFYIYKGCARKWMNQADDERGSSGLQVLWPDTANEHFKEALASCDAGDSYNNTSAVVKYSIGNTSFLWLGDLETQFMENIVDDIHLEKTTIVFAAHHGRESGKIPDSWLEKLDPQIIVIGEAPSRHLHYYTGYCTITQNTAGNITMECEGDRVHFYSSNLNSPMHPAMVDEALEDRGADKYIGTLVAEIDYTL